MATYSHYNPSNYNHFITPNYVWDDIKKYIPRDKVIWEAFYCNGYSGDYLRNLGFDVIHEENVDFFTHNKGDIVVSNPPFETKKLIIERLVYLDKPFILLVPVSTICYQYSKILKENLQIIIPKKRISFDKFNINTNEIIPNKSSATFDCVFICYKMNLEKDIIWLD
tara:strand:+ start:17 stop:517 length:501 start_codon:yes stop_codon:yes gene_type:complete